MVTVGHRKRTYTKSQKLPEIRNQQNKVQVRIHIIQKKKAREKLRNSTNNLADRVKVTPYMAETQVKIIRLIEMIAVVKMNQRL